MTTTFKGKKIQISVYFAALVTLAFALSPEGYAPLGLVCCILHEAGHLLCMKAVGCEVRGVSLGLYGMRIDSAPCVALSPIKEVVIAFGGPLVNIILAVLGVIIKNQMLTASNAVLAVFNLLPVESTDGYNVLYGLLSIRFESEKIKAALRIVSAAFLFLLYCFGFLLLFKSGYNFSALAVAVYLSVKFLFQGSQPYR
ncbi:MAG: hypothetical protein IJZ57_08520 [Clostridia bacterium]|nr:hypothetical protein [Clostridia bacterium]